MSFEIWADDGTAVLSKTQGSFTWFWHEYLGLASPCNGNRYHPLLVLGALEAAKVTKPDEPGMNWLKCPAESDEFVEVGWQEGLNTLKAMALDALSRGVLLLTS